MSQNYLYNELMYLTPEQLDELTNELQIPNSNNDHSINLYNKQLKEMINYLFTTVKIYPGYFKIYKAEFINEFKSALIQPDFTIDEKSGNFIGKQTTLKLLDILFKIK